MSRVKPIKILAIETSCDETAMAIVECSRPSTGSEQPRFKILAEVVASQIETHRPFGGVVPNLAKREHIKNLPIVYRQVQEQLYQSHDRKISKVFKPDSIAVTVGPGLEPALWAGITFAKELRKKLKVPIVGANHLEGHVYSNWLPKKIRPSQDLKIEFPAVCLIVSGGHTILLLMKSLTKWEILGETRDDAVGEAFDKVAKMLNLPYPGGPEVEKLAKHYYHNDRDDSNKKTLIEFPRPMIYDKNYDFSFSGLKTAVLYYLRDHKKNNKSQICASFQKAAIDVLVHKTMKAVGEFKAKSVLLCGGVAANKSLQKEIKKALLSYLYDRNDRIVKTRIGFFVPKLKYNTDNAVMIAAAAYLSKKKYKMEAQGNLSL